MQPNDLINNLPQLRWACRRGMLELDVLLTNFLNEAYESLLPENKQLFVTLLTYPDPDLLAWLMGNEKPEDADLMKIVTLMRNHAKSRF